MKNDMACVLIVQCTPRRGATFFIYSTAEVVLLHKTVIMEGQKIQYGKMKELAINCY
ncbi:MAG: hypothetical protein ACI8RD_006206 [Bacillariaceae sp.]|jgi:hypothetical protein